MDVNTHRQRPKPYHHGDLRNALIQAGLELLSEGGEGTLDLRKVAHRAGVSHAAPYRHFADKQALIAAINEEGFHRLAERIQTALRATPDDAFEQLRAIASAFGTFGVSMKPKRNATTVNVSPIGSMRTRSSSLTRGVSAVSTVRMTFFSCSTL